MSLILYGGIYLVNQYNKAIRDNVPEIIRSSGSKALITNMEDIEYLSVLESKLLEEYNEYLEEHNIDELVDMLEIIYRIAELKGCSKTKLEKMRLEKRTEIGGFESNLYLKSIMD